MSTMHRSVKYKLVICGSRNRGSRNYSGLCYCADIMWPVFVGKITRALIG